MTTKLKITRGYPFSKIGMNEVEGLEQVLKELVQPIEAHLKKEIYWSDHVEFTPTEYRSRDGFIPHSHNCGGLDFQAVIPRCEEYEFSFLEFGECDGECDEEYGCSCDDEGHLSASLRIWFKFEGLDEKNRMQFWLYMGGGNGDAPYFRSKYECDIFEKSFIAKDFKELRMKGARAVKQLLKVMK